jgi:hypothetical protein
VRKLLQSASAEASAFAQAVGSGDASVSGSRCLLFVWFVVAGIFCGTNPTAGRSFPLHPFAQAAADALASASGADATAFAQAAAQAISSGGSQATATADAFAQASSTDRLTRLLAGLQAWFALIRTSFLSLFHA